MYEHILDSLDLSTINTSYSKTNNDIIDTNISFTYDLDLPISNLTL